MGIRTPEEASAFLEARAKKVARPKSGSEIKRIISIPKKRKHFSVKATEQASRENVQAVHYEDGFRLHAPQAESLHWWREIGGVFGAIGVGYGKTLTCLAILEDAYKRMGLRKSLLLIPPDGVSQLLDTDVAWVHRRIGLSLPIHVLPGKGPKQRARLAESGRVGCYLMTYSLLSQPTADDELEAIMPELIVADEAQGLRDVKKAAKSRRIMRYIRSQKPYFCAFSGSITTHSIEDYYHLMKAALGPYCPLPLVKSLAMEWASVLDSKAFEGAARTGPIIPLVRWAQSNFKAKFTEDLHGFRKSYRYRFTRCPGIVTTGKATLKTSISIHNEKAPTAEGWDQLEMLVEKVNKLALTPNDDEIQYAIHAWKWLYELTAGFYNELTWPSSKKLAKRRGIDRKAAKRLLRDAKKHHEALQEYSRLLRQWLSNRAKKGLDTPALVAGSMFHHGAKHVGHELFEAWTRMKSLEYEGLPERDSRQVLVCPYKLDAAVEWAKGLKRGALVWYHHKAIGRWLAERMREAGLPTLHCPAGREADRAIVQKEAADYVTVASLKAHHKIKNLQHFKECLYVQTPRSAEIAEQSLGRMHRIGQEADHLTFHTLHTTQFDHMAWAACLNDALYVQQTTGELQKVIYAVYKPLPKVFSNSFLRERGATVKRLTKRQQAALLERFGSQF